jgi:hypothetical protein
MTDNYNHLLICKKSLPIFISSKDAVKIINNKIHWIDLREKKRLIDFMGEHYNFELKLIKKFIK